MVSGDRVHYTIYVRVFIFQNFDFSVSFWDICILVGYRGYMHTYIPKSRFGSNYCIENKLDFGMQTGILKRIPPHTSVCQNIGRGYVHTCIPKSRFGSNCIENQLAFGMQSDPLKRIPLHTSVYQNIPRGLYAYLHTKTTIQQ